MRLVAFDLDGTLVGSDVVISARVRQAIATMQAQGVAGCIVTGRMYRSAVPFARTLGFTAPLVCYQGAAIIDPSTDTVLQHQALPNAVVRKVIAACEASGAHLQLYRNDEFYCQVRNGFAAHYASLAQVEPVIVPSLRDLFWYSDSTKAVVIAEPPDAERYEREFRERLGERAYVTRSLPEFVEVLNPAVDKGAALRFVAAHLGIGLDAVTAIGDSWNDRPLLQAAGFGIAMGSAPAELRAEADAVVADVAGDGAAEAIERYVLAGLPT